MGAKYHFPIGSRWKCPLMYLYNGEVKPGIIEITKRVNSFAYEYKIIDGMEGDKPPYKFDVFGNMAAGLTPVTVKATNIQWDVDCKSDLKLLPKEIFIPDEINALDEEEVSDYITNLTGFCHKGFNIEF